MYSVIPGEARRAKAWLDERGITYQYRDIKEDKPTTIELQEWTGRSGYPLKAFFNTSGQKYRELGLKDRLPKLTDQEKIDILASDGMLIKRPLLVGENVVLVGFKEPEWENLLKRTP